MTKHVRLALVIVALAVPAAVAITLFVQQRGAAQPGADHAQSVASTAPSTPRSTDPASAAREAARAVMSKKSALAEACWTPLVAKQAAPARSRHVVRETFDAEGNEVSRTVEDVPGQSRADVAECLRALPLDFEIAPGERPITVTVTLAFP